MNATMELEVQKMELIRELLNIDSSEMLDKVKNAMKQIVKNNASQIPCCYTHAELKQRIAEAQADAKAGRGISEEEAERLMEEMA